MKMFAPSQLTSPWGPWGGRTRSVRVGFVALRIARFHNPHCRSSGLKARLSQRENVISRKSQKNRRLVLNCAPMTNLLNGPGFQ
jgi:hypothetical protein